jgi:NTP pyrophosphatase (non-canonical NTP hydrolase)
MIDPKIETAFIAALEAFSKYNSFDATQLTDEFGDVFASDEDFLSKVDELDAVFDENPQVEGLREIFFDLLMINFFSADVKKLEEDYLDTPEWESIEEETLDRGTELLNLLLYLNECEDEDIEPELEDYLKEFLLVDEDEFQDEYRIYELVIANQILIESPVSEISKVATTLPEDSELKELFYPMLCFFQNIDPSDEEKKEIADSAISKEFDMAVLEILVNFQ